MEGSLYSRVNSYRMPVVSISEPDDLTHDGEPEYEDIEDPKWLDRRYRLAYPPNPLFAYSYDCYLQHIACSWTANENDPAEDRDKFLTAPPEFQHILLCTAGCIMIGDSVVLDKLHLTVTPVNVRVMIESQIDRENTHQIVYSKWCDISENGHMYRTEEFAQEYMSEFERMVERYVETDNIQQTMFFIMLCENIMFAPMFQTINYCATLGYSPKLCNDNLLVMRDEYIHYLHARGLLSRFRRKIKISLARQILFEFCDVTLNVYRKIISNYDDGTFNFDHVEKHFRYIVHNFMQENNLYIDKTEQLSGAKLYGKTPAADYMVLPKMESKINLMEAVSTIYRPHRPRKMINMDF